MLLVLTLGIAATSLGGCFQRHHYYTARQPELRIPPRPVLTVYTESDLLSIVETAVDEGAVDAHALTVTTSLVRDVKVLQTYARQLEIALKDYRDHAIATNVKYDAVVNRVNESTLGAKLGRIGTKIKSMVGLGE